MKAIILAAGRGSRMNVMTDDKPKCLVELWGKSLLAWQIEALKKAGVAEIGIVTGYRREMLVNPDLFEFYNSRWADTNMVSSLECAYEWLEATPCIVSYSDIFYDYTAIESLMKSHAALAITYDPNWLILWKRRFSDPLIDAESFRFEANGVLSEIGNKPKSVTEVQGQYMGLLRFTPMGWFEVTRIRKSLTLYERDRMHMTGTLQMIINANNIPISVIPYKGVWGEVDSIDDLQTYQHKKGL